MVSSVMHPHEPSEASRRSYDHLLNDSESIPSEEDESTETDHLLRPRDSSLPPARLRTTAAMRRRASFIRTIALLCACFLSVGCHYASYVLGPMKSRLSRELGTSHTEFSLLISAFSLNSTWTPLLGGLMASRLGTTFTSILATGIILIGQILLLIGDIVGSVRLMALGMFVFGLGVSPVAVVQEAIIVRFFENHGLGVSMAFGLIMGKGASFVSARTSYPLIEHFSSRAPFYVATFLAAMSVLVNLAYISASKWLVDETGAELEAADIEEEARRRRSMGEACDCGNGGVARMSEAQALEKVAAKKRVHLKEITNLGDIFWAYIGVNVLCGMIWSPLTHLAPNIIEKRYGMSEKDAANEASWLLAGSLVLYPVCGYIVDRFRSRGRPIVVQLMILSSCLTMISFAWLALPARLTETARPAIAAFAAGHGIGPLLLVVLVPQIVSLKYVSTALGAHKSLEQAGSTIFQTFAGLALDIHKEKTSPSSPHTPQDPKSNASLQILLNIFLIINVVQLCALLGLAWLQRLRKAKVQAEIAAIGGDSRRVSTSLIERPDAGPETPVKTDGELGLAVNIGSSSNLEHTHLSDMSPRPSYSSVESVTRRQTREDDAETEGMRKRGALFAAICVGVILCAWVLFMVTAWLKLGSGKEKDSTAL